MKSGGKSEDGGRVKSGDKSKMGGRDTTQETPLTITHYHSLLVPPLHPSIYLRPLALLDRLISSLRHLHLYLDQQIGSSPTGMSAKRNVDDVEGPGLTGDPC